MHASVFKQFPVPAVIVAADTYPATVKDVNMAYLEVTGLNEMDVIGAKLQCIFPNTREIYKEVYETKLASIIQEVIQSGHKQNMQFLNLKHKNQPPDIEFNWNAEFIPLETGLPEILISVKQISNSAFCKNELIEKEAEKYYELFNWCRLPLWIYDTETFQFIDVNQAAVDQYGYSRDEFLRMTIMDIRPLEAIDRDREIWALNMHYSRICYKDLFLHKKKNGDIFHVEISRSKFRCKGVNAQLVMAKDVSEKVKLLNTIETKNKSLSEIAWVQSHLVRAPLARIIGIANLLTQNEVEESLFKKLLEHLKTSAEEFDLVIKDVVSRSSLLKKEGKATCHVLQNNHRNKRAEFLG